MRINVTFRHMESSEPVRSYVEEKLMRVKKYIDEPVDAQVALSVEKKIRHKIEVMLSAKGITIKAAEQTEDMYAAIDGEVDKLESQLKRPFARHICDGKNLQDELRRKYVEADIVRMPTLVHPRVTPMPKEKVIAFYAGTNAEKYGAPVLKAVMDCLPDDWSLFSYAFGQVSPLDMESIIEQSTVYVRLTKHDGGMVSAREFLEAGKPVVVTSSVKYAKVVNPDDLIAITKAIKAAGEQKEPNLQAAEYYKDFNSKERYLEQLKGAGVIE